MKTKLDETNLAIIKALRNGRASFRDIAADLGLSEVTVRTRAARLDLILTVLLNEEFGLLDFYTNEFSKCHDRVSSIETFIVYKGFSLKVPYIL